MMKSLFSLLLLFGWLALPAWSIAGDPEEEPHADIFVGRPEVGSQTLIGGALVPDDLNLTDRIFEGDLGTGMSGSNMFYEGTEPGFFNAGSVGLLGATNPPGALPLMPGEVPTISIVDTVLGGLSGPLMYWDGLGPVNFVLSSATFSLEAIPVGAGAGGELDDHPIFMIDDPMSDSLPAGGIYLATLTATLTGLDPSDPVQVLSVTGEEFEEAVELAEEFLEGGGVVPEPSTLAMLALVAVGGICARRFVICK
jgi:hypothetical protein